MTKLLSVNLFHQANHTFQFYYKKQIPSTNIIKKNKTLQIQVFCFQSIDQADPQLFTTDTRPINNKIKLKITSDKMVRNILTNTMHIFIEETQPTFEERFSKNIQDDSISEGSGKAQKNIPCVYSNCLQNFLNIPSFWSPRGEDTLRSSFKIYFHIEQEPEA